jgi:ribosome-associated protein
VLAVEAALDKKAESPVVLDLRGLSDFTDFFLICHGTSDRHALAIAEGIEERLERELDRRPSHVEGRALADWILMDYVDFVVHVFQEGKRQFYRLERLWGDAPTLDATELSAGSADRRRRQRRGGP